MVTTSNFRGCMPDTFTMVSNFQFHILKEKLCNDAFGVFFSMSLCLARICVHFRHLYVCLFVFKSVCMSTLIFFLCFCTCLWVCVCVPTLIFFMCVCLCLSLCVSTLIFFLCVCLCLCLCVCPPWSSFCVFVRVYVCVCAHSDLVYVCLFVFMSVCVPTLIFPAWVSSSGWVVDWAPFFGGTSTHYHRDSHYQIIAQG